MAFHRKPREWQKLAESALLDGLGDEDPVQLLWKAVADLQEALELASLWKNSACNWESKARALETNLATQGEQHSEEASTLRGRLDQRDRAIDLVCGRVEPMREEVLSDVRAQLLEADPHKVQAVARSTYKAFRRIYGLKDDWDKEPLQRRQDLERTIEIIMKALDEYYSH